MSNNLFNIHDDLIDIIKLYNKFRGLMIIRMFNPKRYIKAANVLFKINKKHKHKSIVPREMSDEENRELLEALFTDDELSNPIMDSISSKHPVHELSQYISTCHPNAPYEQLLEIHNIKTAQVFDGNMLQAPIIVFTVLTVLMQVLPDSVIADLDFNKEQFKEVMFWVSMGLVFYISIIPATWFIQFRKERKALKLGKDVILYIIASRQIANKPFKFARKIRVPDARKASRAP